MLGQGLSVVEWGASPRALTERALGMNYSRQNVENPSGLNRTYTHHLAEMAGLSPGATYFFRVGDDLDGWSGVRAFSATRADFGAPLRVAVLGDMGWSNAQALPYLQTLAAVGGACGDGATDDAPALDALLAGRVSLRCTRLARRRDVRGRGDGTASKMFKSLFYSPSSPNSAKSASICAALPAARPSVSLIAASLASAALAPAPAPPPAPPARRLRTTLVRLTKMR